MVFNCSNLTLVNGVNANLSIKKKIKLLIYKAQFIYILYSKSLMFIVFLVSSFTGFCATFL